MRIDWKTAFTKTHPSWVDEQSPQGGIHITQLNELKRFLDFTHIKHALIKPFCQQLDYPVVETRELLPSFETDMWEYKHLPGFSVVAFARPINYFSEIFQFDLLHPIPAAMRLDMAQATAAKNMSVFLSRVPRSLQDNMRVLMEDKDITDLKHYPTLMSQLLTMDRAHVIGMYGPPQDRRFYLSGIYASFPSDLDTEIKRYGLRIGKFSLDNPELYERNRAFVCQHLMELYGYPFSSERRTSAALFARKLHKLGEKFLIRTISQSDRTITTNWSGKPNAHYPTVEKVALIPIDEDYENLPTLKDQGFLVDTKRNVAILRVIYHQHKFSADNVRQERALSVAKQEIIHPITGEIYTGPSVIRDSTNMVLRLNDIVRGEHSGRIVYKRTEIVDNTSSEENRLKFLFAWLSKHQRRIIGYSDEFFASINKVVTTYLYPEDVEEKFEGPLKDLRNEVIDRYSYILQARTIRLLEELAEREMHGKKIAYGPMLKMVVNILHALKFEIVNYFDSLVVTAISIGENILNDRYLRRKYIERAEDELTPNGMEIRKDYGKLISLIDELQAIRKAKKDSTNVTPTF